MQLLAPCKMKLYVRRPAFASIQHWRSFYRLPFAGTEFYTNIRSSAGILQSPLSRQEQNPPPSAFWIQRAVFLSPSVIGTAPVWYIPFHRNEFDEVFFIWGEITEPLWLGHSFLKLAWLKIALIRVCFCESERDFMICHHRSTEWLFGLWGRGPCPNFF